MKTYRLGKDGPINVEPGLATIQAALDAGIRYLDTADFYGMGYSEALIGRAIKGRRDDAFLSVKFGMMMSPSGAFLGLEGWPSWSRTSPPTRCSVSAWT